MVQKDLERGLASAPQQNSPQGSQPAAQPATPADIDALIAASAAMPTAAEQEEEALLGQLLQRRLSLCRPYPEEVCLLQADGVPFLAKGDLCALKSKQKHGKTTAISIMAAAILSGRWGQLMAMLQGQKVLVIDTEQKPQDSQQVYRRIIQMAGMSLEDDCYDRLQMYTLRALEPKEMLEGISLLIRRERPDVVFIDGIVDFITNFNDVEVSQAVIRQLMQMASADFSGRDVALVCVLHTNKALEDDNMRGHAGTMLAQKAGIVLKCSKQDDLFTVSCTDSRHRPVPDWSFQYDRDGHIVDADQLHAERLAAEREIRQQLAEQRRQEQKDEKLAAIKKIITKNGGRMERKKLRDQYAKKVNVKPATAYYHIRHFIEKELLFEDGRFIQILKPASGQLNLYNSDD